MFHLFSGFASAHLLTKSKKLADRRSFASFGSPFVVEPEIMERSRDLLMDLFAAVCSDDNNDLFILLLEGSLLILLLLESSLPQANW